MKQQSVLDDLLSNQKLSAFNWHCASRLSVIGFLEEEGQDKLMQGTKTWLRLKREETYYTL